MLVRSIRHVVLDSSGVRCCKDPEQVIFLDETLIRAPLSVQLPCPLMFGEILGLRCTHSSSRPASLCAIVHPYLISPGNYSEMCKTSHALYSELVTNQYINLVHFLVSGGAQQNGISVSMAF